MRIVLGVVLALAPCMALAEDWQKLDGPAITLALSARVLGYADGKTQSFAADGVTIYTADSDQSGHWRVEGDRYCSVWPPSDRWTCYGIEAEAGGLDIRFVAGDGSATVGRYVDLK